MLHTPKSSIYVLKVARQFLCKSILLHIWQHHSYKEVPLWHLLYSWKKTLLPGILLKFFTYFKIGNKQVKGTSNSNIASPKTKWRSFSHPPTLLSSLGDWWVLVHPCLGLPIFAHAWSELEASSCVEGRFNMCVLHVTLSPQYASAPI